MRIINHLIKVTIIAAVVIIAMFYTVTTLIGPAYEDTYQSVIQRKYDYLNKLKEPKVILIGGSNLAFGIDQDLMSEIIGRPVVNMGLHAGFGQDFNTTLALQSINEDDIVVLVYEYGWFNSNGFDKFGASLVMSGIDNRIDIYKTISPKNYPDIIDEFFDYSLNKTFRKTDDQQKKTGLYSSESFDSKGNMIFPRGNYVMSENAKFTVKLNSQMISQESQQYLIQLKDKVESKGAKIYFSVPSFYKEMLIDEDNTVYNYKDMVEEKTKIKVISNIEDYLFEETYMYDTVYHLNTKGAEIRSKRLARDIEEIIKK